KHPGEHGQHNEQSDHNSQPTGKSPSGNLNVDERRNRRGNENGQHKRYHYIPRVDERGGKRYRRNDHKGADSEPDLLVANFGSLDGVRHSSSPQCLAAIEKLTRTPGAYQRDFTPARSHAERGNEIDAHKT